MVLAPPKTVKTFFIDSCIFLVNFYQSLKGTEIPKMLQRHYIYIKKRILAIINIIY